MGIAHLYYCVEGKLRKDVRCNFVLFWEGRQCLPYLTGGTGSQPVKEFSVYRRTLPQGSQPESVYFITIKYIKAQARCLCHQVYGIIVTTDGRIAAVSTENIKEEVVYG